MITAMATTSSSNRKKTSRVAKSTRPAKSKRPAKPTAAAKVAAKRPANVKTVIKKTSAPSGSKPAPLSPLEKIRSVHLSMGLVYLIFAAIVLFFVSTLPKMVTLQFQARDLFASEDLVVLTPAYEVLFNIQPRYLLVASLLAGVVGAVLMAGWLRRRYEAALAGKVSGLRWLTIGVSSGLLIIYLGLLAGVHDLIVLKLSADLIFLTTMFAWLAERDNVNGGRPRWMAFILSLFTGVLAWLPIAASLIGTSLFGMERFGWHVYALAAVTLTGFTAFALNQYLLISGRKVQKDFTVTENSYLRIDLFTKFAVVLITILALQ